MILGLIPARGGSKRVPRKNLKQLAGRPLIEWTIEAARQSAWLDTVAVTTEDDEIHWVAIENGIAVIRRPMLLATDTANIYDAIRHALARFQGDYTHVCLLHPTSPLRSVVDIDACCGLAMETNADAVVSYAMNGEVPNGAVYVGRKGWILSGGNFDTAGHVRYDMPPSRSVDIDTPDDWAEAERLMAA